MMCAVQYVKFSLSFFDLLLKIFAADDDVRTFLAQTGNKQKHPVEKLCTSFKDRFKTNDVTSALFRLQREENLVNQG